MAEKARAARWGVLALSALLACAFGAAGVAKLAGVPQMVQVFDGIGLGQWFRYVTGAVEVAGALGLLFAVTRFHAAALLTGTMAAAMLVHLFVIGGSPLPALVLLVLGASIAWLTRPSWLTQAAPLRSTS